jgi:hypothetical protein
MKPDISGKLIKNIRICGSGIYEYLDNEVTDLTGIPIPDKYSGRMVFNVYRPAEVLKKAAPLFARAYITVGHPEEWVTIENANKYGHGLIGDTVEACEDYDGETYLYTTGTFTDTASVNFYKQYKEVSCGYTPEVIWEAGEYKGREYQLKMTNVKDVNHIALVTKARGGRKIKVLDGENRLLDEIRRRKRMLPFDLITKAFEARDSASKVREAFNSVQNVEHIGQVIEFMKPYMENIKACDDKTKLEEYLNDLSALGDVDKRIFVKCRDHVRNMAVKIVKDNEPPPPPEKEPPKDKEADDQEPPPEEDDVDTKIQKAVDSIKKEFLDILDSRLPKAEPPKAADGLPNMPLEGGTAKDEPALSVSGIMDALRGGKK